MKPVKCETCQQPVSLSKLFDHMVATHKTPSLDLTDLGVPESFMGRHYWSQLVNGLISRQQIPLKIVNNDLKFFVNWKSYDVNILMFWISFSGAQMKAEDFEYKLKIDNSPENRAKERYPQCFDLTRIP